MNIVCIEIGVGELVVKLDEVMNVLKHVLSPFVMEQSLHMLFPRFNLTLQRSNALLQSSCFKFVKLFGYRFKFSLYLCLLIFLFAFFIFAFVQITKTVFSVLLIASHFILYTFLLCNECLQVVFGGV